MKTCFFIILIVREEHATVPCLFLQFLRKAVFPPSLHVQKKGTAVAYMDSITVWTQVWHWSTTTAAVGWLQLQIMLQSAQEDPQYSYRIQTHSPHSYSWAKAKIHKTMTYLGKTASDVKDKGNTPDLQNNCKSIGKNAQMISTIRQSAPCDNWYFLREMKIIIQWKKRHSNTCIDQREKFSPTCIAGKFLA